ncbi:hypothetical protein B0H66DRAFT_623385 [Apodospora peruviana]|uniref:Uncharacterized protein n=1 Tax=Apodospora peruviana TaxID=516989 RepID=A0AAE0I5U0_9PEZI|nr:hypothetical protein B0H66DRAFT_623385 [Apodospora peruviana]
MANGLSNPPFIPRLNDAFDDGPAMISAPSNHISISFTSASASISALVVEFQFFPILPTEIRLIIWEECVAVDEHGPASTPGCLITTSYHIRNVLALVNWEASLVALRLESAEDLLSTTVILDTIRMRMPVFSPRPRFSLHDLDVDHHRDVLYLTEPTNPLCPFQSRFETRYWPDHIQQLVLTLNWCRNDDFMEAWVFNDDEAMTSLFIRLFSLRRLWFVLCLDMMVLPAEYCSLSGEVIDHGATDAHPHPEAMKQLAHAIHSPDTYKEERLDFGFLPLPQVLLDDTDRLPPDWARLMLKAKIELTNLRHISAKLNRSDMDMRLAVEPTNAIWQGQAQGQAHGQEAPDLPSQIAAYRSLTPTPPLRYQDHSYPERRL